MLTVWYSASSETFKSKRTSQSLLKLSLCLPRSRASGGATCARSVENGARELTQEQGCAVERLPTLRDVKSVDVIGNSKARWVGTRLLNFPGPWNAAHSRNWGSKPCLAGVVAYPLFQVRKGSHVRHTYSDERVKC